MTHLNDLPLREELRGKSAYGAPQLHRIALRIAIECGGKAPGLRHQVIH